jgi:hypothetical protein
MTGRTGRPQRGKARPLPRGTSLYTPGASEGRRTLEQSSARSLVLLHQLPVWVVPLLLTALLITGLAVPGWIGAVALVLWRPSSAGSPRCRGPGWLLARGYCAWPRSSACS